ncbi:RNA-directed DNA polymerase, eukaryota, reverse transcriptase zinc-binding domain protein [Tanacetum coccineum]
MEMKWLFFIKKLLRKGVRNGQTHCVGCNMSPAELGYNIRRMWGKFGLYDIIINGNNVSLFKFRHDNNMETIVEQCLWMVNGKPLMVQKWSPDVCIEKVEPSKIPIWVKLFNVPLEASSVKRISALSNRLGKPLVMDSMTASRGGATEGAQGANQIKETKAVKLNKRAPWSAPVGRSSVVGDDNS